MNIIPLLESEPFINVVGNAASILDKNNGELISKHFTVRFNIHRVIDVLKQGSRTDLLVSGQGRTTTYYSNNPGKIDFTKILVQAAKKSTFAKFCTKNKCELYEIPKSNNIELIKLYPNDRITYEKAFYKNINNEIKEIIRSTPRTKRQDASVGFIFLHYMFVNKIKNINLFGFDWKESISLHTKGQFVGPHNYKFEKEKVIEWANELNWNYY